MRIQRTHCGHHIRGKDRERSKYGIAEKRFVSVAVFRVHHRIRTVHTAGVDSYSAIGYEPKGSLNPLVLEQDISPPKVRIRLITQNADPKARPRTSRRTARI